MSSELHKFASIRLPHITDAYSDLLKKKDPCLLWIIWFYCDDDECEHDVYTRPPEGLDIFLHQTKVHIAKEKTSGRDAQYLRCTYWDKDNLYWTPESISDNRDSHAILNWFNRQQSIIRDKLVFVSFAEITREPADNVSNWRTLTLVTDLESGLPKPLIAFLRSRLKWVPFIFSKGKDNVLLFNGKHITFAPGISIHSSLKQFEAWFDKYNSANRARILADEGRKD